MFVSAILLAAGESTRMATQKALLPWEGATLLEYQLMQLAAVDEIGEIIVVTGHEPDRITEIASRSERTRVVHNTEYRTGKVSSIKAGVGAASLGADALLLLAVDQPRAATIVRAVIDNYAASRAAIVAPANSGWTGHPVLFDRALRAELMAISEDTQGIRALMRANAAPLRVFEVSDPSVHLDLNTLADVDSARAQTRRSTSR